MAMGKLSQNTPKQNKKRSWPDINAINAGYPPTESKLIYMISCRMQCLISFKVTRAFQYNIYLYMDFCHVISRVHVEIGTNW